MVDFSRDMETITKSQRKRLEIKSGLRDEDYFDRLISRLNTAKEGIGKLDKSIEITVNREKERSKISIAFFRTDKIISPQIKETQIHRKIQ